MRNPLRVPARALALLLLFAPAAAAHSGPAPDPEPGRNGPYLSLAGVYAFENFDNEPGGLQPPAKAEDTVGFTVRGGWRFSDGLG